MNKCYDKDIGEIHLGQNHLEFTTDLHVHVSLLKTIQ